MGLFGFGKKKNDDPATAPTQAQPALTLSAKERVEKHAKALDLILSEKKLGVKTARVCFVIDTSGSMQRDFQNGTVQDITERIMPLGLNFDDDGEMETFWFSSGSPGYGQCTSAAIGNIDQFVDKEILTKSEWGGTNYAPVMKAVTEFYGIKNPSKDPTFVVFITDGDNHDKQAAEQAITKAAEFNIFWKFVGVGSAQMSFLEKLDDMPGRKVDNANFIQIDNIRNMSDEQLYPLLLEEYGDWIAAAMMAGILN